MLQQLCDCYCKLRSVLFVRRLVPHAFARDHVLLLLIFRGYRSRPFQDGPSGLASFPRPCRFCPCPRLFS